ncbi:Glycerophosphoryl diester phosphodiesterase [Serinicoccus hydrothermalis]|uniref:Glycerophosphoryl diester phosphodiesterase n=1 Tax=Serinicoccus hydrothermalis TaxID=1758689 RepID=A0A1B1N8W4_9MICO|nr:Glycerophosphoryl diester phosphodiesterase [Serinicoccus hydrothermalis]
MGALGASLTLVGPPALAADTTGTPPSDSGGCAAPEVVGHRGSGGTSPENTVASIRDARRSHAASIEIDVQLSADGTPFIFHDATGTRTTDVGEVYPDRASSPIVDFTWAELQQLDAGSYFSPRYAGEGIPHLDDAARALGGGRTTLNIEIKSPEDSPGVEAVLAEALTQDRRWQRLVARDRVVVSSFDEASLTAFHELAPQIPVLQIGDIPADDATLDRWAGFADGVVTNYRILDPADIDRVRARDLELGLYTLNSPEAVDAAADLCVDEVITDFPTEMVRLLRGRDPLPRANGIEVSEVVANPDGDDLQPETGEHVVLTNTSRRTIDVSGYQLQDAVINRLVVGEGYTLAPGAELRVYTGPGTDTPDRFYNDLGRNVLNNTGDSVAVLAPRLRLLDLYAY